ncbi:hypothetical protein [Leptolyngbya sp. FACHB-541]|nr:hypothetical protein [Leptolyngbya sp. FACHB-541]
MTQAACGVAKVSATADQERYAVCTHRLEGSSKAIAQTGTTA